MPRARKLYYDVVLTPGAPSARVAVTTDTDRAGNVLGALDALDGNADGGARDRAELTTLFIPYAGTSVPPEPGGGGTLQISGQLTFDNEYNPIAFWYRSPEDIRVTRLVSWWELSANTSGGGTWRVQAINFSGGGGGVFLRGALQGDPDTYKETILPTGGPFMPVAAGEELLINLAPNGMDPGISGSLWWVLQYELAP